MDSRATKEKRIRFDTDESGNIEAHLICYIKAASEMQEEEISDLWYLRSEMTSIRKESKRIAWEIQRRHKLDPNNPKSYANAYRKVYELCHEGNVPRDHGDMLQIAHWIGACPSRRGLERRSVTKLYRERQAHVHEYRSFVVQLTSFQAKDVNVTESEFPDFIQRRASEKSLASRRFARCLGVADELAAWKQQQRQQDEEIVPRALFESPKSLKETVKDRFIRCSCSPISSRQRLGFTLLEHDASGQIQPTTKKNTIAARNA